MLWKEIFYSRYPLLLSVPDKSLAVFQAVLIREVSLALG